MRFHQLWMTPWLISLEYLHMSVSITVKFLRKDPLYVAPGRTLVLEVQCQLQPGEGILLQTWERINSLGEFRVAEEKQTYNSRTFMENDGQRLRINGVIDEDYGTYKFTVTANNGNQVSDARQVKRISNPPETSLSMQCSVSTEGAQWDKPVFTWLVDGEVHKTDEISANGSTLLLKSLSRNYTCITDSSQGTSKVDVRVEAPDPEPKPDTTSCSCTGWIVFAVLEFVLFGVAVLLWYYCKKRIPKRRLETNPEASSHLNGSQ